MVDTAQLKKPSCRISKGAPPARAAATVMPANLQKAASHGKVPIQFKVPAEVRREVKTYAVAHDYEDQSALFVTMWEFWKQHNP
jgi:hypothetical protein